MILGNRFTFTSSSQGLCNPSYAIAEEVSYYLPSWLPLSQSCPPVLTSLSLSPFSFLLMPPTKCLHAY